MTDDIQSMEVSGYLCTLTSAGLVGIESSRNIYVPTVCTCTCTSFKGPFFMGGFSEFLFIFLGGKRMVSCGEGVALELTRPKKKFNFRQ